MNISIPTVMLNEYELNASNSGERLSTFEFKSENIQEIYNFYFNFNIKLTNEEIGQLIVNFPYDFVLSFLIYGDFNVKNKERLFLFRITQFLNISYVWPDENDSTEYRNMFFKLLKDKCQQ